MHILTCVSASGQMLGSHDTNHRCTSHLKDGLHCVGLVNKLKLVTKWLVWKWEINKLKLVKALLQHKEKIKQNYVLDTVTKITALYCTKARTAHWRLQKINLRCQYYQPHNFTTTIITFIYKMHTLNTIKKY